MARDGRVGSVEDFLFDSVLWTLRYLVVKLGGAPPHRRVLVPEGFFRQPDWNHRQMPVHLTKKAIEESPSITEDAPVSRQRENEIRDFFGLQPYFMAGMPAGVYPIPMTRHHTGQGETISPEAEYNNNDPHLRSCTEVKGYAIGARDGEMGSVDDFLMDDQRWVIRYVIVDTRAWLPGKRVLMPLIWITDISWKRQTVLVDVKKEQVHQAPDYNPSKPINRQEEEILFDYYGRKRYPS